MLTEVSRCKRSSHYLTLKVFLSGMDSSMLSER